MIHYKQQLEEIEKLAIDVSGFISVTKDACEVNDYVDEYTTLEYAHKLQQKLVEMIMDINVYEIKVTA